MGKYRTVETYVEVDVALEDFSDEELIEELESRNVSYHKNNVSCEQLLDTWILYRDKFEDLFREYCRDTIGKSF
jgi:hypothetical protein